MLPNVPTPINTRLLATGLEPAKESMGVLSLRVSHIMHTSGSTLVEIRLFASVFDKISVLTPLKPGHMIVRDFSNIADGKEPTGQIRRNESGGYSQTNRHLNHGE